MRISTPLSRVAVLGLLLGASCAGAQGMAEAAITSADQAEAAVGPEVSKVMPDQMNQLTEAIASARASLEAGEYQAALDGVKGVPAEAQRLAAEVPAKTAELTQAWNDLAPAMARNMAAVQSKIDEATRTRRMPRGMDAAGLENLKSSMSSMAAEWSTASTAFQSGNLAQAMAKATELKAMVSQAMASMGMVSDERAWGNAQTVPK